MKRVARLAALAAVLFVAACAAPPPRSPVLDLRGVWTGENDALVHGAALHHPPGAPSTTARGAYRLRSHTITYRIDGQEGRRFWGTMASPERAGIRLIGSFSIDNQWIYMVSHEGYLDGTVIDANTIEMCYRHADPQTAVIGCNIMKRQK